MSASPRIGAPEIELLAAAWASPRDAKKLGPPPGLSEDERRALDYLAKGAGATSGGLAEIIGPKARDKVLALVQAGAPAYAQAFRAMAPLDADSDSPLLPCLPKSYAGACRVLRDPDLRALVLAGGDLEFNEMGHVPTLQRQPLEEHRLSEVRERTEVHLRDHNARPLRLAIEDLRLAVAQVARERPFHPVRNYLGSLRWDGVERLRQVAPVLLGNTEPLAATLFRKWCVAAVARAFDPGCKMDSTLILVGEQGAGKSRLLRALAPDDSLFGDSPVDLDNPRDAILTVSRTWIWELAELDALKAARSRERVKAFLSSQVDRFRPPYARETVAVPRSFIFAGSTNDHGFLTDPTGSRRLWPVRVGRVDVGGAREVRDDLWAEAVHLYRAGEPWHLAAADEAALATAAEDFHEDDAWTDQVLAFATGRDVTVPEVLAELHREIASANGVHFERSGPPGRWTKADQMRVAEILRRAGYRPTKFTREGRRVKGWAAPVPRVTTLAPPVSAEVVTRETPAQPTILGHRHHLAPPLLREERREEEERAARAREVLGYVVPGGDVVPPDDGVDYLPGCA